MKKNKLNIFYKTKILILSLITFASCTVIEEDTSGILSPSSFFQTEVDYETSTIALYEANTENFTNAQSQLIMMAGDDLTTRPGANKQPFRDFDQYNYGAGEAAGHEWVRRFVWEGYWKIIYNANTIIGSTDTSPVADDIKLPYIGEAHYMRAFAYYWLVRTYGGVPLITTQATGDETRASVLDIYNLIESDLLIAAANLPSNQPGAAGRATSGAAKTMLSSFYLTWAGWPLKDQSKYALAAAKAKEVIDGGNYSLLPDFADLWLAENDNNSESIFSQQYSIEAGNYWHNYGQGYRPSDEGGWVDGEAEIGFFNRFPEGHRKDETFLTIFTRRNGTQVSWEDSQFKHPTYWKWMVGGALQSNDRLRSEKNVELYRYAEVLLTYAEAQIMATGNNSDPAALEALNMVKRRALNLPVNTPNASVDVTSATQADIVAERGWEFAGEFTRWFDLVRTETVEQISLLRDPSESPLIKTPTKANYIAPIPTSEILLNPKLIQNPEGNIIQ